MFTIIGGDGKEYGPVTADQIRAWMAAGRANLDTQARAEGATDWKPLREHLEFSGGATKPPPIVSSTSAAPKALTNPASRGARFGAAALDTILLMLATLPGNLMAGRELVRQGVTVKTIEDLQSMDWTPLLQGFGVMVLGALALGLGQIILLSLRGQTLGKRIVGIRIVRVDDSPAGFLHAVLLRGLVPGAIQFVLGIIPFVPLGLMFWITDICFIFRDDRRCIHDLIGGTKVVNA